MGSPLFKHVSVSNILWCALSFPKKPVGTLGSEFSFGLNKVGSGQCGICKCGLICGI